MIAWLHVLPLLVCPATARVRLRPAIDNNSVSCTTDKPVLFMSHRGQYLSDQSGTVAFSSNACGWEQWTIKDSVDGSVTIQSHTGKYLSSNQGALELVPTPSDWEQFRIQYSGTAGKMHIVNYLGQYLQDNNGRIQFSPTASTWEQWRVLLPDESPACTVGGDDSGSGALPRCRSPEGCVTVVQTARFTADRLKVLGDLPLEPDTFAEEVVVDVGSGARDQKIDGFGGAFTETSAHLFGQLPKKKQEEILDLYFGTGASGIGYNTGRVHINSCDFSPVGNWNEDDVDGDKDLEHFDTEVKHDMAEMIPFIKAATAKIEAVGESLKLLASPWSPPGWMKRSGQMQGSTNDGQVCLKDEYVDSWAQYISKWITAYEARGVLIWAITVQNEPDNIPRWEACFFPIQDEVAFVRDHLGPELNKSHPNVGIFFMDSYQRFDMEKWAEAFYVGKDNAAEYVKGMALHWYDGDYFADVAKVHKEFPQAVIIQSEATWEFSRTGGSFCEIENGVWRFGEGYAHDIVGILNAGGVGWIDWNLILDSSGGPNHVNNMCDAAIMVDGSDYHIHPQFWYMGHFSKYLHRGSERVVLKVSGSSTYTGATRSYGTCTEDDGLQATAFERPDGRMVVVALNCGDAAISFKIKKGDVALRAQIPAHAIQTYIWPH